ncbi:MAG TPA: RcnB family protein [Rhizomicrobium sp.]|jgi:Ni/Co efflux regulator RcnB|nr:RcnB family protein [Rhizomicrobium sp.]
MRRLLIPAIAALSLLIGSPTIALAAHHKGGGHAAHAGSGGHAARASRARTTHAARAARTTRTHRARTTTRRTTVRHTRNGTVHRRVTRTTTRHRAGNRTVVRHNTRVNVTRYRGNFRSARRYHYANWRRPGGWYAHRWGYGQRLPGGWYGRDYWLTNYVSFGLIAPPDNYQWIREGDDAVLVDIDTGEIIRVQYGVFY